MEIEIEPRFGAKSRITIGGLDVSSLVQSYELFDEVRRGPSLLLRLSATHMTTIEGEAHVRLDPLTVELLGLLGWTPPKEQTA